jgi:hypothetical protein
VSRNNAPQPSGNGPADLFRRAIDCPRRLLQQDDVTPNAGRDQHGVGVASEWIPEVFDRNNHVHHLLSESYDLGLIYASARNHVEKRATPARAPMPNVSGLDCALKLLQV